MSPMSVTLDVFTRADKFWAESVEGLPLRFDQEFQEVNSFYLVKYHRIIEIFEIIHLPNQLEAQLSPVRVPESGLYSHPTQPSYPSSSNFEKRNG